MKTCIDLFAGIGGFSFAARRHDMHCVWSCEIDKYAQRVYHAIHAQRIHHADARKLPDRIPHANWLFAGIPCQPFSTAQTTGIRGRGHHAYGASDIVIDVVRKAMPDKILLENVPPFLRHKKCAELISAICDLGYSVQSGIINAMYFDVPQMRRRAYILFCRGGGLQPDVIGSMSRVRGNPCRMELHHFDPYARRVMPIKVMQNLQRKARIGKTNFNDARLLNEKRPAYTLIQTYPTQGTAYNLIAVNKADRFKKFSELKEPPRMLSFNEARAIMGFNGYEHGLEWPSISYSRRMRLLGNSVCPPVISEIIDRTENP